MLTSICYENMKNDERLHLLFCLSTVVVWKAISWQAVYWFHQHNVCDVVRAWKIEKFCPHTKIAQRVSLVQPNRITCLNEKTWISTLSIPDWTPLSVDSASLQMVLDGKVATRLQRLLPPAIFENSLGCASPVATSLGSLWKMDQSASLMVLKRRHVTLLFTELLQLSTELSANFANVGIGRA